ncbi:MAG: tol-pal system protein YbgF [Nitrospirota bacterium]
MMSTRFRTRCLPFFILTSLVVAGCATTSDFDALRNDTTNVQVETLNQKREIAQIKSSLSDISRDLSALKDQGFGAIRESQSSLLTQTSDLSKEIQILKGRFDESKYFMDKSMKELLAEKDVQQARMTSLENEIKELKARLGSLSSEVADIKKSPAAAESAKQPEAASAEQKTAAPAPADTAAPDKELPDKRNPQRFYDDAQIDLKEKRYAEAREKFEKFAQGFPKHTLAPNAVFWIGETYYAEKKYEDAILSYESFLKQYADHDKARGAMLKQAYAFIELGDRKTGKVILERIIEKYPRSTEAELAEKKIAEVLSRNGAPSKTAAKPTPKSTKKKK